MALPKQVEQQMNEIAEIERAMAEQTEKPVLQTEQPPTDAPELVAPVAVAPTDEPVVTPEAPVKPVVPEETWEQKYRTFKGMFDSTVPPLHAKVKELTSNLQSATSELERLKSVQAKEVVRVSSVTPQDEEAFGADLLAVQQRIVDDAVSPLRSQLETLESENAALRDSLGRTGSEVATLSFEQRLQNAVPDFEAVNTDPNWVAWLDEIDPLSLEPRRAQAEAAYGDGNVAKVAHYVSLFKRDSAPVPAPKPDSRQSELQSQVAPNRSQSSPSPTSPTLKLYTEAEASKLYDRVAELNRVGKYEEGAKLDAELTNAYNSGRVR